MKTVAIILCKSYSRRIPNKNFMLFDNKPIVQHTIEKLIRLKKKDYLEDIILSTDSDGIYNILKRVFTDSEILNHILVEQRKEELLQDDTPMGDVVKEYCERNQSNYDLVLMVYPTAILLDTISIIEAIDILENNPELEAVIPVVPGPNPEHALYFKDKYQTDWINRDDELSNSKNDQVFYPSGNWNLARIPAIIKNPRFYALKHRSLIEDPTTCIDLDYPEDIKLLKALYIYENLQYGGFFKPNL